MELEKIFHLHTLAETLHVEIIHDMKFAGHELPHRLHNITKMLKVVMEKVEEIGGLGNLNKEIEKRVKYGLRRVEFFLNERMVSYLQGSNDDKDHLKRLGKDVLQDVPLFPNPDSEQQSFVGEVDILIDRKKEKEKIIGILLTDDSNNNSPFSVVPILGMAGTGKTHLAHLVFQDKRVRNHFDKLEWVNMYGVRNFTDMLKNVARMTGIAVMSSGMSKQVSAFKSSSRDKKYLFVLGDLSDDQDFGKCIRLLQPLLSAFANCKPGSKILFTSRSTSIKPHNLIPLPIARGAPYLLQPLHLNDYLALMRNVANRNTDLIDIGLQIIDKCANDLHTIRIIASILSSEPTNQEKWQYLYNILLATEYPVKSVESVLHLMQQHYSSLRKYKAPTKLLLNYSTLFPRDYKFSKVELQQLWEVRGFLAAVSPVEKFNETFEKLLVAGYFSENRTIDKTGVTVCYNITEALMHEVAKHLASDDYIQLHLPTKEVDAQHVSFIMNSYWEAPSWLHDATLLKSLIFLPSKSCRFINIPNFNDILLHLKSLQALDVSIVNCSSRLDSIWELKQLRYLRLGISFESLPEYCITNLRNLITLDLRNSTIRELPKSFHQLRCLRHLYTGDRLIDLPPKFGELTQLQTLDVFVVGKNNGLEALTKLWRLSGKLKICYRKGHEKNAQPGYNKILADKVPNILSSMKLDDLSLVWSSLNGELSGDTEHDKDVMEFEFLQPPSTLRSIGVQGWKGVTFPPLVMDWFSILPNNLVYIRIENCERCRHLPSFGSFSSLEFLQLRGLDALEWIEVCQDNCSFSTEKFPSLKYLILVDLPQLKGWSKVEEHDTESQQQELEKKQYLPQTIFNCLSELKVSSRPKLMSMPLVPSLEKLEAINIHENLLKHLLSTQESPASSSSASSSSSTLKKLHINSVHELESLSITIPSLQVLTITECMELTNLLVQSSNSLRRLKIRACHVLKDISRALHNLSLLEELVIESCEGLDWAYIMDDIEQNGDSTEAAKQGLNNLRSLTVTNIWKPEPLPRGFGCLRTLKELSLCWLYNMRVLPESIGHLTQLNRLAIRYCPKLKKLSEYFPKLKSLVQLDIKECPKLERRCKQPNGEDCNLIDHIPNVHIG